MEECDRRLIQQWLDKDQQLRQCVEEHQKLEKKLEQMQARPYLSTEDEIEIKKIKKLKLAEKDRIEKILARYRAMA
ncbi:MAG: DUF465 domain-containing protein [Deltaproteobacteria bacterium]|nr:DUF465 domain-containing protein [Deltaproteobacteria bacterium]MBW2306289.1 DUF465 domain-containing protein [Deltaproteobacteria bacterium]